MVAKHVADESWKVKVAKSLKKQKNWKIKVAEG